MIRSPYEIEFEKRLRKRREEWGRPILEVELDRLKYKVKCELNDEIREAKEKGTVPAWMSQKECCDYRCGLPRNDYSYDDAPKEKWAKDYEEWSGTHYDSQTGIFWL